MSLSGILLLKAIFVFNLFLAVLGLQCSSGFSLVAASGACSLGAAFELLLQWSSGSRPPALQQLR